MKKNTIIIFVSLFYAFAYLSSFAQAAAPQQSKSNTISIKKFEPGKALSSDDIAFLLLISKPAESKSQQDKEVTIDNKKYKAGYTITAADVPGISKLLDSYASSHPEKIYRGVAGCPCNCCFNWDDSSGKHHQTCCQ